MTTIPLVSIVIPVLHDTSELAALLEVLAPSRNLLADRSVVYQVVVVNGDPNDGSLFPLFRRFPEIEWVESLPGRGRQMNYGARLATGRWLLFLHADAYPERGWIEAIEQADRSSAIGGAFRFRLESTALIARVLECGVDLRTRLLGLPYGDQGVFVRRQVFNDEGGYAELPIMEDLALVRRLRRRGALLWSSVAVRVSARRWERDGWVWRSVLNIGLVALFFVGISPAWLARRYYAHDWLDATDPEALKIPLVQALDRLAPKIVVIIPALDEEESIGHVLDEIPDVVTTVTVADNGSIDRTAEVARAAGARVVTESTRGYGRACLAGLRVEEDADVIVFLDADRSDYPEEMNLLLAPILAGRADFVLGYRRGVGRPLAARLGTALCVFLINLLWRTQYRDLGPFRAITRAALDRLRMVDKTWGWTIEMQVKAAEAGLRIQEVMVRQRPRIGRSKISGTILGTLRAGLRMIVTIWLLWRTRHLRKALFRAVTNG
jgi:rSAM/selenodomain-associated transferase 2